MKRFFQRIKSVFIKQKEEPVPQLLVDELAKPVPSHWFYSPYVDEPSVFSTDPNGVSPHWVGWAQGVFRITLEEATIKANAHKRALQHEQLMAPHRTINSALVPDMVIHSQIRGKEYRVLSLEWVLWYAYSFNEPLQDAHNEGAFLTSRTSV